MRLIRYTLLLSLAACVAPAATLERLSLEEMTARSTAIVRARAVSNSVVQVGSNIYTKTRFEVLERWRGPEGDMVDVMEPGGTLWSPAGQITQSFPGVPRFTPGQEMVLFLWTGRSGRTQVIGLTQGAFEVARNAATGEMEAMRNPSGELMLEPGSGKPEDHLLSISLRRLERHVRSTLERLERNRQE